MKSAVVTGATGFVGRWLVRELIKEGISVIAVVRPDTQNKVLLPIHDMLKTVECEMHDYIRLPDLIQHSSDCVFYHLAWTGVSGGDRVNVERQLENVYFSAQAVEAAYTLGCTAFVGMGTIMEEESAAVSAADGSRPGMSYIYGEAKHAAHLLTKAVAAERGIAHLWPMLTNAYGEYEYSPRFINMTLRKILRNEPLEFTAGTQMYDFIHIEDAVKGLIAVGQRGKPFHSYVIGSGGAAPLRTFVERLGKVCAPERELRFGSVPYTGVQLPANCFSIDALTKDTGFLPQISWETGIQRTMEWIRKTEEK